VGGIVVGGIVVGGIVVGGELVVVVVMVEVRGGCRSCRVVIVVW
jgi:hypothetical protein